MELIVLSLSLFLTLIVVWY